MSKKVKGQKLDLASFVGPNNPTMNLPTAPDPTRQRGKDVKKSRDDDRFDRNRDNGQGWTRNVRSDEFSNQNNENGDPWRKSAVKGSDERSDRTKWSSQSRSSPTVSDISDSQDDKWSKVFKNSDSGRKYSARAGDEDSRTVFRRPPREDVSSMSLPTAPRSVAVSAPVVHTITPVVNSKDVVNELKVSKSLLKQESERKAKELKEQQRQESIAAAVRAKEESEQAYISAEKLLSSGLKGTQLLSNYSEGDVVTTGSMFLKAVLFHVDDLHSSWWLKADYGGLLLYLLRDKLNDQVDSLFVVQEFCHSKGFPKVELKGVSRRLIEVIFGYLLSHDLIDLDGFISWADDDTIRSESSVGRLDAIVQTSNFIQSVRQALISSDEVSEDEEEVDAPRAVVK